MIGRVRKARPRISYAMLVGRTNLGRKLKASEDGIRKLGFDDVNPLVQYLEIFSQAVFTGCTSCKKGKHYRRLAEAFVQCTPEEQDQIKSIMKR